MQLTTMDWVRATLANAKASGMDLADVIRAAEHAASVETFDNAVNILADTLPTEESRCSEQ